MIPYFPLGILKNGRWQTIYEQYHRSSLSQINEDVRMLAMRDNVNRIFTYPVPPDTLRFSWIIFMSTDRFYYDLIVAGFGGQGVMVIGNLLAHAAMEKASVSLTFLFTESR